MGTSKNSDFVIPVPPLMKPLMELLAIRLSCKNRSKSLVIAIRLGCITTTAKSLVISNSPPKGERAIVPSPAGGRGLGRGQTFEETTFSLHHPLPKPLSHSWERGVKNGFTLIELLVVMAIIATLLAIAVPRYFGSVDHSKEVALKQSLNVMRDAIDKFYGDTGAYPETLGDLVTKKYLREIPVDPITDSATTWQVITPPDGKLSGVYNVKSGGSGTARDGSNYQDW